MALSFVFLTSLNVICLLLICNKGDHSFMDCSNIEKTLDIMCAWDIISRCLSDTELEDIVKLFSYNPCT